VRYFQAWAEPIPPEEQELFQSQGDNEEGGEWGTFTTTPAGKG